MNDFLSWYWKDLMVDVKDGLLSMKDAEYAFNMQLNYYKREGYHNV